MSSVRPYSTRLVGPGQGVSLEIGSSTMLTALGRWSDGSFNVLEQRMPPGLLMPPHLHEKEVQGTFVITGVVGFWIDGEEFEAGPGSYVHRPAGRAHAIWNGGIDQAHMLEITSPAEDFERYLRELSDLISGGGADPESVGKLAARHGVHFVNEPIAGISARHGVSPEGGFWR